MHSGHSIPTEFVELVKPFILKCSTYAAEMDLSQYDPVAFQQAVSLSEKDLVSILGITKFEKCREVFAKYYDFDLRQYRATHPFMAISALTQELLSNGAGPSLDQQLFSLAQSHGLLCTGLESFDRQLQLFQNISADVQARMLYRIACNPRKLRQQLQKMLRDYINQDAVALYNGTKDQLGALRRLMLYERNQIMSQRYLELHQSADGLFAAVGAAHLSGGKGIVRYLKIAGAAMKPIPLTTRLYGQADTEQNK